MVLEGFDTDGLVGYRRGAGVAVPFSPANAATWLANTVPSTTRPPASGWPFGAPTKEFSRSPAAYRVAELAADAGLGLFHYEWRHHLELPEVWVPAHDPELALAPTWRGAVLPERKYQSFRHDQPIGGYHPGMRAKWATHELCHGLVGFAWEPGASPLFVATASRIAEMIPVVLWYFLDEAHLRRCPLHAHGGALYRRLCPACESAAAAVVDDFHAEDWLERGRAFVEGEFAAIARTRRTGRPVPHIYGSLDLCSDGLAYAGAHADRLNSKEFERFAADFLVEDGGWVRSLDALQARALAVLKAVTEGEALTELAPSADAGRARWTCQDLAWRLLTIGAECDGETAAALDGMVDGLAAAARGERDLSATFAQVASDYRDLFDEVVLPEPQAVFALGYEVPGVGPGRSVAQLAEGARDAVPLTAELLGDGFVPLIQRFVDQDRPVRVPLGARLVTSAAPSVAQPVADLMRYEAALVHLGPADAETHLLARGHTEGPVVLADGVRVLHASVDVVELAKNVEFGDMTLDEAGLRDVDGQPVVERETWLVLARDARGEPAILDVDGDAAQALMSLWDGGDLAVEPSVRQALDAHGVLRAVRWPMNPDSSEG